MSESFFHLIAYVLEHREDFDESEFACLISACVDAQTGQIVRAALMRLTHAAQVKKLKCLFEKANAAKRAPRKLERDVIKAARRILNNQNEFGQVTDEVYWNDLYDALTELDRSEGIGL